MAVGGDNSRQIQKQHKKKWKKTMNINPPSHTSRISHSHSVTNHNVNYCSRLILCRPSSSDTNSPCTCCVLYFQDFSGFFLCFVMFPLYVRYHITPSSCCTEVLQVVFRPQSSRLAYGCIAHGYFFCSVYNYNKSHWRTKSTNTFLLFFAARSCNVGVEFTNSCCMNLTVRV